MSARCSRSRSRRLRALVASGCAIATISFTSRAATSVDVSDTRGDGHEDRRARLSHDLAGAAGRRGRGHRPDAAAASIRDPPHRRSRRGGGGDQDHGGARRAADRRDRGLWPRARAARRSRATRRSERAYRRLLASRPTAVNLRHALDDVRARRRAAAAAGARRGRLGARRRILRRGRRAQSSASARPACR